MSILRSLLIASSLLLGVAQAETLTGRVVGVADGDTITVLDADRQQHKVRLQGIDAPERAQPFGQRSKENLSRMVFGKDVRVEWEKRDRYGRIVGKVWVQPASCPSCPMTLDAGHAQITVGLAWWYRKYAEEQAPQDRGKRPAVPPVVLHSVGAISGFLRGGGDGKKARRGILAAAS